MHRLSRDMETLSLTLSRDQYPEASHRQRYILHTTVRAESSQIANDLKSGKEEEPEIAELERLPHTKHMGAHIPRSSILSKHSSADKHILKER